MSYADEARLLLEARQLLAKQRNKPAVINYYINRGMDADQAHEMIESIYKENLTENRGAATKWLVGGIGGVVLCLVLLFTKSLLILVSVIGLPVSIIIFIIGVGRWFIAKGYEMDE